MITAQPDAVIITLTVAIGYLVVLWLVDLNEREPFWGLLLFLASGTVCAVLLRLLVSSATLELTALPAAIAYSLTTLIAMLVGLVILAVVERLRGWSELTDLMDAIVYGAATGLGIAAGTTLARETAPQSTLLASVGLGLPTLAATSALAGLAHGAFGAIVGLAVGVACGDGSKLRRYTGATLVSIAAVAAHAGYSWLAHGNTLGGLSALSRTWTALILPILFVAASIAYALGRERHAIEANLAGEVATGIASQDDIHLLRHPLRRKLSYLTTFAAGRFSRGSTLMSLHNRQVQLALMKRRRTAVSDDARRMSLDAQIDMVRKAIQTLKQAQ